MFDLFRSQRKVVKYVLGTLLTLVALSMVVTMIPNVFSSQPVDMNDPVLVEVGDESVTATEVFQGLREYAQAGTPADSMAFMARQVVDNLVEEKVLMQEAANLGVRPTEAELAGWIREQMPFLWQGGQFNRAQYQQMIMQRFQMSVPQFEADLLKDLTIELRLRRLVTGNIIITEDELKEVFEARNEKAQIDYLLVKAADFTSQVEVTDAKLSEYFEAQKFRYRIPQKRTVKVIDVIEPAGEIETEVTDVEVRTFYEQNRYRFETPERVMASHILLMTVNPEAPDPSAAQLPADKVAEVEAKAREVLEKVKAGEDFAKLAEEYSEDPGTKGNGGDLGWVYRGVMLPEFEEAAFALNEGQVSQDLVKTDYGFHIIKVEKKDRPQLKSLDEVREQIVADLKAERQEVLRMERLDKIMSEISSDVSRVDAIAAEYNLPVMTYSNFDQRTPPADLTKTPTFIGNIFAASAGQTVTNTEGGVIQIAAVTEVVPARDATMEEVRENVRRDYVQAEARKLAEARAKEVAEAAKTDFQAAARQFGLKVQSSNLFTRRDTVEGLGNAAALGETPFKGAVGDVFGPVPAGEQFAVARVAGKEAADMTEYPDQKTEIRENYLKGKQDEAFNIFRVELRQRFEREGKIKRYDDRINQVVQQIRRS